MAITSYDLTWDKKKNKKLESRSPYLINDKVQLVSRLTEKKIVHKKTLDYVSSFPLAVNLYKANSGELNSMRKHKRKNKKSVLTLLNEPAAHSQKCTVSDINDSEYYSQSNGTNQPRLKKRTAIKNVRKPRSNNKDYDFRDSRFCPHNMVNMDINLNCSSTEDDNKNYKGDCKMISKLPRKKRTCKPVLTEHGPEAPHHVWSMLKNMNRFQYVPSPPMSGGSIEIPKKKKIATKKCIRGGDRRVIETAEFAYISSYSVDNSTLSESSSIDRVTVINKQDEFSKICKAFEQRFLKPSYANNTKNAIKEKNNARKRRKRIDVAVKDNENTDSASQKQDDSSSNAENNQCGRSPIITEDIFSLNPCLPNNDNSEPLNDKTEYKSNLNEKECSVFSCYSESSKAESSVDQANKNILKGETVIEVPLCSRLPQLKGISRALFRRGSKGIVNSITVKKTDNPKGNKTCIVTAMPRACAMPKLTESETKKKIAKMRFPIVLLDKNEVRPIVGALTDYDPPHFNGLDKQIWPFMVGWHNSNLFKNEESTNAHVAGKQKFQSGGHKYKRTTGIASLNNTYKMRKPTIEPIIKNKLNSKNSGKSDMTAEKNKTDNKKPLTVVLPQPKKQKPMAQIKDRMLNLLFQKLSEKAIVADNITSPKNVLNHRRSFSPIRQFRKNYVTQNKAMSIPDRKFKQNGFGYPWAKAKRASDFIENVIKKVKNGVYYSQDKHFNQTSIQLKQTSDQEELCAGDFSPKVTIKKKNSDAPKSIPGFDSSLPVLEIKTLNKNQIFVKHCLTNITMQFDVSFLVQTKQILMHPKTSLNLIPIDETGSQTKTFKCDTTIMNAMLPAQLCSIIPKMMSEFEIASNLATIAGSITEPEIESPFATIAVAGPSSECHNHLTSLFELMSSEKKKLLRGTFSIVKKAITKVVMPLISNDCLMIELLPKMFFKCSDNKLDYRIRSFMPAFADMSDRNKKISSVPEGMSYNSSTLQHYTNKNKRLTSFFKLYDFEFIIKHFVDSQSLCKIISVPNINIINIRYDGKLMNIQMRILGISGIEKDVSVTISNLSIITQRRNDVIDDSIIQNSSSIKCIDYIRNSTNDDFESDSHKSKTGLKLRTIKNKMRTYRRLYRKCKSATNMPIPEKNTPLDKIITLDDFLQVIGSKAMISAIFDDYSERKIMTSLKEMNRWITEINPAQALLVLLLTNKKDTTNLVRYRTLILQGIAVNRITKAKELDMEIEVVERENLNKIMPQYEGISYLPETCGNRDQLLEELYWIAKTTASDYQKPFDESSEKLLKSLLEKRKKLNPSYLRVMARYVGLGLLKSPAK